MAFPTKSKYRVYVSADGTAASYVAVTGTVAWDRTNEAAGEAVQYMGGTVGSTDRTRTVSLSGLVDFADAGQEIVRDAAESGDTVFVALVYDFTSTASLLGFLGEATVTSVGDSVDLGGDERPPFAFELEFSAAYSDITALP